MGSRPGGEGIPQGALALPGWTTLAARAQLPGLRVRFGPVSGAIAMASLVAAVFVLVLFAASGPSLIVARSTRVFPGWESGPLHGLFGAVPPRLSALIVGLSLLVVAMTVAYGVALGSARSLSGRTIAGFVVLLHLLLALSPPLLSSDLFNYMGYLRLGGLHGLNPYTHVIAAEMNDPVYAFTTWRHLHSPYGPLFTAATALLAGGSMAVTYWTLKVAIVAASLGVLALVWRCARALGRDPRPAVVFVALNPIYLVYALGGFHNDFLMLLAAMGAVAALLAGRDRLAGSVLMAAVAIKLNAALLLPFLLIGAGTWARRRRMLEGAALGAIPLIAVSLAAFGATLPNLSDQTTLITGFSVPNLVGLAIGAGGATPLLLRCFEFGLIAVVVWLLVRRADWLADAGWAMLALAISLGWLMPWYVLWAAALAAVAASRRLRHAVLAFTVFLVITGVPETPRLLDRHGIRLLDGPAGKASRALERKLAR